MLPKLPITMRHQEPHHERGLDEFYGNHDTSGEHYIMWTDQWMEEFQAMKLVVEEYP